MINVKEFIELTKRPKVFEQTGKPFWIEEYISQQVLKIHLDPNDPMASRLPQVIRKTVNFIAGKLELKKGFRMLDVGCGPGLYCEEFAEHGISVVGIDFSKNSIEYARKSADKKKLDIEYHICDYLQMNFNNEFDCVVIIFYDFCVLSYEERARFLKNIYASLKPGGYFVFDIVAEFEEKDKLDFSSWSPCEGGFWHPKEHLVLSNHFYYENDNTTLDQFIVISGNENSIYRNYLKAYKKDEIFSVIETNGFKICNYYEDLMGNPYVQRSKSLGIIAQKV